LKKKEPSSFDLPTYLESKFAIDSASLNAPLYARFREHLRRFTDPRILDLGTGTGAMLRRVMHLTLSGRIHLIGLDQEEQNLAAAVDRMESILEDRGYRIVEKRRNSAEQSIHARRRGTDVWVEFLKGDLLDSGITAMLPPFDCITAHAFMDLMPLKRAVAVIRSLLKDDGVFYSTLNYDGLTVLVPEYEDDAFERRLLRIYNRSMEARRIRGRKTGGAFSGRRLFRTLSDQGFLILGGGSSDWNVFPSKDAYTEGQKLFLTAVLSLIETEARQAPRRAGTGRPDRAVPVVEPARLAAWYADRLQAVQNHELALIVHQLDLLAKRA
jgi:SAM-dependent methyltransferase